VRRGKREDGGNGHTCFIFHMTWTSIRQEAAMIDAKHGAEEGRRWEDASAGTRRREMMRAVPSRALCYEYEGDFWK